MGKRRLARDNLPRGRVQYNTEPTSAPHFTLSRQVLWDKDIGMELSSATSRAVKKIIPSGARRGFIQHRLDWQRINYIDPSALQEQLITRYSPETRDQKAFELICSLQGVLLNIQKERLRKDSETPKQVEVGFDQLARRSPLAMLSKRSRDEDCSRRIVSAELKGWSGMSASYPDHRGTKMPPGLSVIAREQSAIRRTILEFDNYLEPEDLIIDPFVAILEKRKSAVKQSDVIELERRLEDSGVLPVSAKLGEVAIACSFTEPNNPGIAFRVGDANVYELLAV